MHHRNINGGATLGVSLLSALASAGVTYFLFGTKEGEKTRRHMKDWAHETKDKLVDTGDDIKDATFEVYSNLKSALKDRYEDLKDLTDDQKKELAKKIKNHWEMIKDDIDDTLNKSKADIKM